MEFSQMIVNNPRRKGANSDKGGIQMEAFRGKGEGERGK